MQSQLKFGVGVEKFELESPSWRNQQLGVGHYPRQIPDRQQEVGVKKKCLSL